MAMAMWQTARRALGRRVSEQASAPVATSFGVAASRLFSTKSDAELAMQKSLQEQLEATHVKVVDVSGGCGSMYDVEVVSPRFAGQSRVKQHRLVTETLKAEIKEMHGLTIRTMTPEQFARKQ